MATFTVTNAGDSGEGSLRQAILDANANPGADEIVFDSTLAGETITLETGELIVTDDLAITGNNDITIDGNQSSRVFNIDDGDDSIEKLVILEGLTITGGSFQGSDFQGGGIINQENLSINTSTITGNSPDGDFIFGAGIFNAGSLTINNSTISGNSGLGATFYNSGGGIFNDRQSDLTVNNSTISENGSTYGDGIYNNGGSLSINNSTVYRDRILNYGGSIALSNSIIQSVRGDGDTISNGINLVADGSVNGSLTLDPLLGPLQNNGGPTETHELLPDSPAIDLGNDALIPNDAGDLDNDGDTAEAVPFDQRGNGFPRIVNSAVDLGAVEFQGVASAIVGPPPELMPTLTVDTLIDENDFDLSPGDVSLREAIAFVTDGGTVNFAPELAGGTIDLNSSLKVNKSLTVNGLGADRLTLDAGGSGDRVFLIDDGDESVNQDVKIHGLTITNGDVTAGDGGGILNEEDLIVSESNIANNNAQSFGLLGGDGGGIANQGGATLRLLNSTVSENGAYSVGGISNNGEMTIVNSTIFENNPAYGYEDIGNSGTLTVLNSTVTGASNLQQGIGTSSGGETTLESTIVSQISDFTYGGITNATNSLIQSGADQINGINLNNITDQDPLLDPAGLQDNGGPTPTIALQSDSPAIDAGSNPEGLTSDQRGPAFEREVGGQADIGAFEAQPFELQPLTGVLDVQLINATTNAVIDTVSDGEAFYTDLLPPLDTLTIAATLASDSPLLDRVESAFIDLNSGEEIQTDSTEPYSLYGDSNGNFFSGDGLSLGNNSISFDLYSEDELQGDLLDIVKRNFSIVEGAPAPTNLVVNTLVDELDGSVTDGDVSLRDAISAIADGGTITFDDSLLDGTIELSLGQLDILKSITIDAENKGITVDANQQSSVFRISDFDGGEIKQVFLDGLTITGGGSPNSSSNGLGISNFENLTLINSTVSGNSGQGGIRNSGRLDGALTIINSTISNNYSYFGGAGIVNVNNGDLTVLNSTISGNYAGGVSISRGGGIYTLLGSTTTLISTIVANNSAYGAEGDNLFTQQSPDLSSISTLNSTNSLIETDGDQINGTNIGNIIGEDPLLDPAGLQDNGGPTPTIALQPNSPAIDAGSNPEGLLTDQRGEGFAREINGQADIGAFEVQEPAPKPDTSLLFSISHDDRINGLSVKNEDIVQFDGSDFSILFDGSDVGLGGRQLSAFDVISHNEILISLNQAKNLPGIGKVRPQDVIKFTATSLGERTTGHFSKYFDGSDVGLYGSQEKIDAITGLPNGDLLLSTAGTLSAKGGYRARREDISRFKPNRLGANTRGKFSLYFDGSDVGLGHNNIDAFTIDSQDDLIVSTGRTFQSRSLSARKEDAFGFTPTSLGGRTRGSFASDALFNGSQFGLRGNNLLGIDLADRVPLS